MIALLAALALSFPNPCAAWEAIPFPQSARVAFCIYAPEDGQLRWVTAWDEQFNLECYTRGLVCLKRETWEAIVGK